MSEISAESQRADAIRNLAGEAKLFAFVTFLYVTVGATIYPWWWGQFMRGGAGQRTFLLRGIRYAVEVAWPLLFVPLVLAIVLFFIRNLPLAKRLRLSLRSTADWFSTQSGTVLVIALGICCWVSLNSARGSENFTTFPYFLRDVDVKSNEAEDDDTPLAKPTLFAYLAKSDVESLFGMYEPELVPASVVEELQNTTTLKAGISLKDYLSTEAGKEALGKKLTEYRRTPKTPERKVGDVVRYLLSRKALRRFGNFQSDSDDIRALDKATVLLTDQHVTVNRDELRAVRDKLLAREVGRFLTDLQQVSGFVLVEGNWTVAENNDQYVLTRFLIENVSDPPVCQIKVPKLEMASADRDVISEAKGTPIRLSVFGHVIMALSSDARTLRVKPIAIY